jgi:hypothetical protein
VGGPGREAGQRALAEGDVAADPGRGHDPVLVGQVAEAQILGGGPGVPGGQDDIERVDHEGVRVKRASSTTSVSSRSSRSSASSVSASRTRRVSRGASAASRRIAGTAGAGTAVVKQPIRTVAAAPGMGLIPIYISTVTVWR